MVRRFFSFIEREIRGLHEAAYLLAGFALLSQVLALMRDRTFAHYFGAGEVLDIYFAAFRIPDLIFAFLTLFVSSFALVPLFSRQTKKERGEALGSILVVFGVSALCVTGLVALLLPFLLPFLVPGFSQQAMDETRMLSYILLLQPVLLGLSSIVSALVQASRMFMLFALAPIFYNVGIIVGVTFLYPVYGMAGLAYGVVLGAALHLSVQLVPVCRMGIPLRTGLSLTTIVRSVVVPSLPRSVALVANQSLLIAFASIGSLVSVGAVSALSLSFNLQSVPLTVIGLSYASALFPALAALYHQGDLDGFRRQLWETVEHILFWLLPATMFFIVLRAHIVRVVLGSGAFSWDDTRLTAAMLALFAVSLLAQCLLLVFSRALYAAERSALPIILNVGASIVAGVLAYTLVAGVTQFPFLHYFVESLLRVGDVPGTVALMIPFAYSVVLIVTVGLFAIIVALQYGFESRVLTALGTSFSASVIGAAVAYATLQAFGPLLPTNTFLGIFTQGLAAGGIGGFAWLGVLYLMRSEELGEVVALVRNRLKR